MTSLFYVKMCLRRTIFFQNLTEYQSYLLEEALLRPRAKHLGGACTFQHALIGNTKIRIVLDLTGFEPSTFVTLVILNNESRYNFSNYVSFGKKALIRITWRKLFYSSYSLKIISKLSLWIISPFLVSHEENSSIPAIH